MWVVYDWCLNTSYCYEMAYLRCKYDNISIRFHIHLWWNSNMLKLRQFTVTHSLSHSAQFVWWNRIWFLQVILTLYSMMMKGPDWPLGVPSRTASIDNKSSSWATLTWTGNKYDWTDIRYEQLLFLIEFTSEKVISVRESDISNISNSGIRGVAHSPFLFNR